MPPEMPVGLSMQQVITAWETGASLLPLDRALVILDAAGVDGPLDELPLAARDIALLEIRFATFGDELVATATCPECDVVAEVELACRELAEAVVEHPVEEVTIGGTSVSIRSLTSGDIARVVAAGVSEREVHRALIDTDDLTDVQLDEIARRIDDREGDLEVRLGLTCPDCGHAWSAVFDPVEFLWAEIADAARTALNEVAEIAREFGWSEADILALSDQRRRHYLELVRRR